MMTIVHIAQCSIRDLAAARQATVEACLSAAERASLGGAPARRLAGVMAVKRAVLEVARGGGATNADGYAERDVQIGHAADGAPRLDAVPLPLREAFGQHRIHISISHTGDHAFGLAVFEGES
jgi:phosphopantetheinyl transferase (holo-ACP synthase)